MIIKTLYLIITGFLISIGVLKNKLANKDKALLYIVFTTAWCFGVFGVSLMFEQGTRIPPNILFYIAITPTFIATTALILSIK